MAKRSPGDKPVSCRSRSGVDSPSPGRRCPPNIAAHAITRVGHTLVPWVTAPAVASGASTDPPPALPDPPRVPVDWCAAPRAFGDDAARIPAHTPNLVVSGDWLAFAGIVAPHRLEVFVGDGLVVLATQPAPASH